MNYNVEQIVSIDMKTYYPESFQSKGEATPYFERFGHPRHQMTRLSINGPLPQILGLVSPKFRSGSFVKTATPSSWRGMGSTSERRNGLRLRYSPS